jgi:hypothetical protein
MRTFKELLGTDNKKKQLDKIEELLEIAAIPEITLQIRYNGIDDQVILNIFGGDVSFDALHRALELTSKALRREEVNVAGQQQVQDGEDKVPGE